MPLIHGCVIEGREIVFLTLTGPHSRVARGGHAGSEASLRKPFPDPC